MTKLPPPQPWAIHTDNPSPPGWAACTHLFSETKYLPPLFGCFLQAFYRSDKKVNDAEKSVLSCKAIWPIVMTTWFFGLLHWFARTVWESCVLEKTQSATRAEWAILVGVQTRS